jgi:hypothetical protein
MRPASPTLPAASRPSADESRLTPFVPRLYADVEAALRALVGAPPDVHFGWRDLSTDGDVHVALELPDGPDPALRIVLRTGHRDGPAWFIGAHVTMSYKGDLDEFGPLVHALRRRVEAIDRLGPERGPLRELHDAWRAYRAHRGRTDLDFRNLTERESILRLGFQCNQRCSFCWQGRDWTPPPAALITTWLDEMAEAGVHFLTLSGGEPTLYAELPDLVRRATQVHGMTVVLQTNAVRFARGPLLEELASAGVRRAIISYHRADPATSDAMTEAPGTHAKTEAGIVRALQAGLGVELNCVVEQRNAGGLADRSRRIVERFLPAQVRPDQLGASYSYPTEYHDLTEFRRRLAPLDVVAPHLTEAIRVLERAGMTRVVPTGSCGFPLCTLRDHPEAIDLTAAERVGAEHKESRVHPPECAPCVVRDACIGPRQEYLEVWGARGLVPFAQRPRSPSRE